MFRSISLHAGGHATAARRRSVNSTSARTCAKPDIAICDKTSSPRSRMHAIKKKRDQHTFWSAFGAVRLHRDVRVQVVESAIRLLAAVPAALVHALNLLVATTGPLVLLRTRDGNEGVDL